MRRLGLLALPLLAAGCEQPPAREIAAAEALVEQARLEGAESWSAERWREAQGALATARQRVHARDYRGALSAANLAADRARSAVQAVRAARALARTDAQVAQAEVRALLEEVETIRQEANAAKVPEEAFATVGSRVAELEAGLQRVSDTLDREPLQAQRTAAELKAQAADLPTAFRQAQAKWQAEHAPSRRRRRR